MGENSKIEWTDASWNVTAGCTWASPGCDHCYAARMTRRLEAMGQADYAGLTTRKHFNGTVRTLAHKLDAPLHWRKPRMVFVNSMSDLFHEDVPFEFIVAVFGVMAACPLHTFQVLTKRPERMAEVCSLLAEAGGLGKYIRSDEGRNSLRDFFGAVQRTESVNGKVCRTLDDPWMQVMNAAAFNCWPLSNVWLGTSVENQAMADERLRHVRRCPAAVRFLSVEPMLGHIDLRLAPMLGGKRDSHFSWVICGGESGPGARPLHPDWVRSIRDQCQAAGAAFFFKQWGAWLPGSQWNREELVGELHEWKDDYACRVGKKAAGRLLDGRESSEFPNTGQSKAEV